MRTLREIEALLGRLDECVADDLEDQDLDFKEWGDGDKAGFRKAVDWAICMANGGGGVVVFGVVDKVKGRARAIRGVPPEVDVHRLKRAVYDGTDPKLTPVIEEIRVPEGTGRLVVMFVYDGMPPYTDTAGRGLVRVGKDCKPLTGTMRPKLAASWVGEDFTAEIVSGRSQTLISTAAMETLRREAGKQNAPTDLLRLGDEGLLEAVGVRQGGRMTRAALLLGGTEEALRDQVPNYLWTHLRMESDTDYTDRADGNEAIAVALARILDRISANNPIHTVVDGPYHFEYRTYPEVALREAVMNALSHVDHRIPSPILVKQFPKRIEMTNAGGLIGGTTPENILHRAPASRNSCLVGALLRLRLINRSTLGMQRIFSHLLMEGKETPFISDLAGVFRLTFRASPVSAAFRFFVAEESFERGVHLSVDHLLILNRLRVCDEVALNEAARLCHRPEKESAAILAEMERSHGYLERSGEETWRLTTDLGARLTEGEGRTPAQRSLVAGSRVEHALRRSATSGGPSLSNADIRSLTGLDRRQVNRLVHRLEREGKVRIEGHGRAARYAWVESADGGD